MELQRPLQENHRIATRTQGGGQHHDASPFSRDRRPRPRPHRSGGGGQLLLLHPPALFLSCCTAAVCYKA